MGPGRGADAEGGEVRPEVLGDVRWRQSRGDRRRLFAVPDDGDSPARAPCPADEKTDEGGEPEKRGKGGELEGDLTEAAPSSSSSGAGDDDDDPFLSTGFVSAFSAFSRERERVEGRGRQREVRRHERLRASSPSPLTTQASVEEEEEAAVVGTTTTTSKRQPGVTLAWSKRKVLTRRPREEGWRWRQSDRVDENTGGVEAQGAYPAPARRRMAMEAERSGG
uniref:Uncharacterized protein n=1 Tax=Oryza meridionalis TaxID=40149 RepID=A0A0E0ESE9_9ORYZ